MRSTHLRGQKWLKDEFKEACGVFREAPLRAVRGLVVIALGMVFIAVLALAVTAGALLWNVLFLVVSLGTFIEPVWRFADRGNPFRWAMELAGFMMWRVVYPLAGIRVTLDTDELTPIRRGEVGKAYIVHPSYAGIPPIAYVLSTVLPHLWCIPMKRQMMMWPVGWAVRAIRMGVPIHREKPRRALLAIQHAAEKGYTLAIMPEGTRPTPRAVTKTIAEFKRRGMLQFAGLWRYTSCPLPSGALTIEHAMPDVRRILVMCASSFEERGIAGLLRLIVYRGTLAYKAVNWDIELATHSKDAFAALLCVKWHRTVHPWIASIREEGVPS